MTDEHIPRRAKMDPRGTREDRMNDQPRKLGGRYELVRVIGRGGMALVSKARDTRLSRDVAVKELRIDLASDHTFQARFRREAQAAGGLNHPNIVSVYDTGEELDLATNVSVPYIVMELVEGRTLRDILRDGRPILPRRALEFTQGVLEALAYSHKAGIVHRDIKPANVMITNTGIVKVMDFGIARAVSDTSSTMTQTAAVIGTAQYFSPEQARGETVDNRSDIYSAGCLLYELLVGRPPFQGDSPVSVAYQHVREVPVPPSQLDAEVTAPMDAVVLKALAKDPDDRYQTATEMRDDIHRILGGERVVATLPPPVPPLVAAPTAATTVLPSDTATQGVTGVTSPVEPERKRRSAVPWIVALVTLLAVGLIAGFMVLNQPRTPTVRQVAVPANLINRPQALVEATLRDAKLEPVVSEYQGNDDSSVGTVLEVRPVSGTMVNEGSSVTITVNVGPKKQAIPTGLLGRTYDQARAAIVAAGFPNVRQADATDEPADAKAGTVLSVSPTEGTEAPVTQVVTVTVATGRARVPFLTGMTREGATAEALKYGFGNVKFEEQESTITAGTVIATRPLANTLVPKADALVIILAKAPVVPTTPATTPPATTSASPSASKSP